VGSPSRARVEFCGEVFPVTPENPVIVGREGRVAIDDNPYLHRRFLEISDRDSLVWLTNLGSQLSATVSDQAGLMQAWLAPGARLPLVFGTTVVWFTAGPTTYELEVVMDDSPFRSVNVEPTSDGDTTIGRLAFTPDQKLLILALAEDVLRRGNRGAGTIPASSVAADRLGWTITKFNRKLDNVCQKVSRGGVRGLHGDAERLASNRRARLVEYSLAARLVSVHDLHLLDAVGPDGATAADA
jgi:hypothetical protein